MGEFIVSMIILAGIYILFRIIMKLFKQGKAIKYSTSKEKDNIIKDTIKGEINGFVSALVTDIKKAIAHMKR